MTPVLRRRTPPPATTSSDTRGTGQRAAEALASGVAGAAVAGAFGRPLGVAPVTAAIGGLNGAISGWHGVYAWRRPQGVAAFALDSTWAIATTAAGLVSHGVAAVQPGRGGFLPALSTRQDRHVYAKGMVLRTDFATTWGNVVNGAGATTDDSAAAARRRQLVTDHEDVHVWQARLFGPVYPLTYLGWMVAGGAVGAVRWVLRRDAPIGQYVESTAYYANPWEWWAYSRDRHWPPRRALRSAIWRKPAARPLDELR